VRASFVDALVEHVKVSEDAAERFIDTIRSSGKYMQDVW
jgi:sulfite reductase alpha subunit-like flavoprotein